MFFATPSIGDVDCENESYINEDFDSGTELNMDFHNVIDKKSSRSAVKKTQPERKNTQRIDSLQICLLCQEKYRDRRSLNAHMRTKHKLDKKAPIKCKNVKLN